MECYQICPMLPQPQPEVSSYPGSNTPQPQCYKYCWSCCPYGPCEGVACCPPPNRPKAGKQWRPPKKPCASKAVKKYNGQPIKYMVCYMVYYF